MKMKPALFLAVIMATSAMAQNSAPPLPPPGGASNAAPAAPSPVPLMEPLPTAPAKKAAKAKAPAPLTKARKPETEAPGAPFNTNDIAVSKQDNVNIRAQSHINSEIIARLKNGETVTAMGEVTLKHPKTDEPARWVQVELPEGTHVWVSTSYLGGGQTVTSTKLNVRSGPGENYSVIGLLHKGDTVKIISTKGDWTEIQSPPGSFGFIAAHLLAHKEMAPPPPPVITTVAQNQPPPVIPPPSQLPPSMPPPPPPVPIPAPAPVVEMVTPPTRIAVREGTVGPVVSIQAPTYFRLLSLDTGRPIDYLYTTSTNLDLNRYLNMRVLVTGEESLDERWPETPVLTIQKMQPVH